MVQYAFLSFSCMFLTMYVKYICIYMDVKYILYFYDEICCSFFIDLVGHVQETQVPPENKKDGKPKRGCIIASIKGFFKTAL
jgi:hypothetical protein